MRGLFAGRSAVVVSTSGDGAGFILPGPGVGVGVRPLTPEGPMPFSVASLYLRIFALDILVVKWNTETYGSVADMTWL
jgi:hypothetical protein